MAQNIKAFFKCRICGQLVITDVQVKRDTPLTIEGLKADGILDDHCMLCECPGFMTLAAADRVGNNLSKSGVDVTPESEIYGVADLIQIIKI